MVELNNSLVVEKLCKSFGQNVAVAAANFFLKSNEIVALAGGNGSGKSTLLKMIFGAVVPDSGYLQWNGQVLKAGNPGQARALGIEMVFQDCALCGDVSVLENLFLGQEPLSVCGFLKTNQMRARAREIIDSYQLPIPNLEANTKDLSGGQQKAVAIGRALLSNPKLLLLDEPTAALGVKEQQIILQALIELKSSGVGILISTHSPDEIATVADRVLVLQRGQLVRNQPAVEISRAELAILMST